MFKASNFLNYYVIFLVQGSLFLFSVLLFFLLLKGNSFLFALDVYSLKSLHLSLDFILDKESILFFLSLSAIICGVFTYSASYMAGEKYFNRFMGTLSLFALSMMVLIFSGNYFSLMIGWDGLGVTSFLLVIFFQNKTSTNAGLLTVFTNRIGDVFIMTTMGLLLVSSSWSIASFAAMSVSFPPLLSMLMILAAFTKSAQIPFSSWLPAAMAAPTPVSSLVHSSTLVTAGVYLLFRFKDVFMTSSSLSGAMLLSVGSSTMVMAGLAGMYEDDLKKMVALSTLSQLGLMISCLGLSAPQLAFFHLLSHAYFKALLFMATGSMIHSVGGYQDLRVMRLPFSFSSKTSALLIISNLSLMGLPFLSGFYSKDLMLETAMSGSLGLVSAIMFILGTALTVLYSSRFVILSSSGGLLRSSLLQHLDQDWLMFKGYDFLFFLAIAGGSGLNYLYLEAGPSLSLSFEFKNSILLLIAGSMSFYLVTQFQPTQSLKKVIGRLLNLSLLSKSFMKNWLFFGVLSNESLVEKFSLKMGMFASLMLALTSPRSLDSRSLMIFWGVSGLLGGSLVLI